MILRQHRFGIIQTADGDIDFFRKIVMLERQRCPARGAKAPRGLRRRSEPRWLTGKDPETSFGHAEPRDEGSPTRAAANRTVAIGFMKGQIVRLVANGLTKTPTLHHTRIPPKNSERPNEQTRAGSSTSGSPTTLPLRCESYNRFDVSVRISDMRDMSTAGERNNHYVG
jgi:hypothetical protein